MKPRFHAGKFMAFLKPLIIDLGEGTKVPPNIFALFRVQIRYLD